MGTRFFLSGVTLSVIGVLLCVSAVALRADEEGSPKAGGLAIDVGTFAGQRAMVEAELAKGQSGGFTRADLLAMLGRSSAASGDFELSAAAYVMFLDEFGSEHAYSQRIALRLIDSLAPLDLETIDIRHTPEGPRYEAAWRLGKAASEQRLRQAVLACEYAAGLTKMPADKGRAWLRMGWIQRALNDWPAATRAWQTCADVARGLPGAADALWLTVENQRWTGQYEAAVATVRRFMAEYPKDERGSSAGLLLDTLQAEARRARVKVADSVQALQAEIAERRSGRGAYQVFREVADWHLGRGERQAWLEVTRWAVGQTDWSLPERVAASMDLTDALLGQPEVGVEHKAEAARVLADVVRIAPDDSWRVRAALRRSKLLRELNRAAEALDMWRGLLPRLAQPDQWVAESRPERIRVHVAAGELTSAAALLDELTRDCPEHPELSDLRRDVRSSKEGQ